MTSAIVALGNYKHRTRLIGRLILFYFLTTPISPIIYSSIPLTSEPSVPLLCTLILVKNIDILFSQTRMEIALYIARKSLSVHRNKTIRPKRKYDMGI